MGLEFWALYLFFVSYLSLRFVFFCRTAQWWAVARNSEYAKTRRVHASIPDHNLLRHELKMSLRSFLVAAIVPALAHHSEMRSVTKLYSNLFEHGVLWLVASYWVLFFFHDCYYYWAHRLMHSKFLFRLFHRVHHENRNPTFYTTFSMAMLETVVEYAWIVPLIFLIPLNIWMLDLFSIISCLAAINGHSEFDLMPSSTQNMPVLRWLASASTHNLHHQKVDGNYGLYTQIWDRAMNTRLRK